MTPRSLLAGRARRLLVLVPLALSLAFVAAAEASYPGKNGKLIYEYIPSLANPAKGPYTVSPYDPSTAKMLTKTGEDAYSFEYSPNGKLIAFEGWVPDQQIIVMNARGTKAFAVTKKVEDCHAETFPTWSPDGKRIAFRCDRADGFIEFDVYSVKIVKKKKGRGERRRTVLVGKDLKRVTNTTDAYKPVWSPLGNRIAYTTSGNSIYAVPAGGGAETLVSDGSDEPGTGGAWFSFDWHPAGNVLVVEGVSGAYLMNPNSGALVSGEEPLIPNVSDPIFSPDGKEIAYTKLNGSQSNLAALNLVTQATRFITTQTGSERTPSWQPLKR